MYLNIWMYAIHEMEAALGACDPASTDSNNGAAHYWDEAVAFYSENATILKDCFTELGFETHGGENAPYVWVRFPGATSWESFADILAKCDIVTTPGSGFGPSGEGFVRASAFGSRDNVLEAVKRFKAAIVNYDYDLAAWRESVEGTKGYEEGVEILDKNGGADASLTPTQKPP